MAVIILEGFPESKKKKLKLAMTAALSKQMPFFLLSHFFAYFSSK